MLSGSIEAGALFLGVPALLYTIDKDFHLLDFFFLLVNIVGSTAHYMLLVEGASIIDFVLLFFTFPCFY